METQEGKPNYKMKRSFDHNEFETVFWIVIMVVVSGIICVLAA
ncbi:MAG: hypothetical protein ACLQQ4_10155 [Bacteroidia bacterium]